MKYLLLRGKTYWYKRNIPKVLNSVLDGFYHRESLSTFDLEVAKKKRDALVIADDDYWDELKAGGIVIEHAQLYDKAVARAKNMRLQYVTADKMADDMNVQELLDRIASLENAVSTGAKISAVATIGSVDVPAHKMSDLLKLYSDKIMAHDLTKKNEAQQRRWQTSHERYVRNFISVCGDVAIENITRMDGLNLKDYFADRIIDTDKSKRITAGAANREIGTLAVMYKRYHKYFGIEMPLNPFGDLKFKEGRYKKRDHFEIEWLKELLTKPELTAGLNIDARVILFCMVETGMRPIEICNIDFDNIIIDNGCPRVIIEPREGYELKTENSQRILPLVGVSALAFTKLRDGNENRYIGKPNNFSGACNKFFRKNGLYEREGQSVYSMRHTFKNRMIIAGIDTELRDHFMGHAGDRPEYGIGGSIEHRYDLLEGMRIEFEANLFDD